MLYFKEYPKSGCTEWVIFVHGAGGSSSIWFKQLKDFCSQFNVLMIDLRGHGKSAGDKPYNQYTFNEICGDIIEVMDHTGIRSAHFVGISLGTILIRNLCEMAPDRVKSMVLGGAIMRLNRRAKFLSAFGDKFKTLMPYLWLYKLFAWIIMPRERHRESRILFVNEAKKLCQREFIHWYRLIYEVNPLLRYFTEKASPVPTLYLMGEEDHMFLPFIGKLVKTQENASLCIIKNSGHVCNVESPDRFNQESIGFINRVCGYSA
jgi:pimeloyl-ACP methyl ester carboxylesterase